MGMFDSLYDAEGREWQTKAFECLLDRWDIGDEMPAAAFDDYQLEVIGGPERETHPRYSESLATVRAGRLVSVNDERDPSLPLIAYYGDWKDA